MSARLSVVMIAKNAADLLPDCLASVAWADEIVLLDSGSTDATVEVARAAGVQVYINTDWQGYGIQRQRAQEFATTITWCTNRWPATAHAWLPSTAICCISPAVISPASSVNS